MADDELGTRYQFLPSARRGYQPDRTFEDLAGDIEGLERPGLEGRAELPVELTVGARDKETGAWDEAAGQAKARLRIYGPGDIVGIDNRQILRMEPEPETNTLPPNCFPFVELASADLPWLFSPAGANDTEGGNARSIPWLCLVVVERSREDVTFETATTHGRPVLEAPAEELPPLEETWAWAHVQVVGAPEASKMEQALTERGPQAVARLLCPRNLDANTRYRACLVPVFDPGRRAGLGQEPYKGAPAEAEIDFAWSSQASGTVELPVYHQWTFTTGTEGDFQALVRQLSPANLAEHDIGETPVDLSEPGPDTLTTLVNGEALVSQLGGALRSLEADEEANEEASPMQEALLEQQGSLLEILGTDGLEEDVIGPPVYGRWHLPADGDAGWSYDDQGRPIPPTVPGEDSPYAWCHELNVDPVNRIAAGLGTQVIQEHQERLMELAWLQFGDLAEGNHDLGRRQVVDLVGEDLLGQLGRLDEDVLGMASRVRDLLSTQAELASTGGLRDEGPLGWKRLQATTDGSHVNGDLDAVDASDSLEQARRATLRDQRTARLRLRNASSAKLRALSQVDGKLNPTPSAGASLPTSRSLRPPRQLDERAQVSGRLEQARARLSPQRLALLQAGGPGQAAPGQTDWRIGPGGQVLSLAEAFQRLPEEQKPVPKTLLQVQSARNHTGSVRRILAQAWDMVEAGELDTARHSLIGSSSSAALLEERAIAIRRNAFTPLARQASKLVAAGLDPVDDAFTPARKRELFNHLYDAHAGLMDAVDALLNEDANRSPETDDASQPNPEAEALEQALAHAQAQLDEIDEVLNQLVAYIDPGIPPQDRQATLEEDLDRVEPARVDEEIETTRTQLLAGNDQLPGVLDAARWTHLRASLDVHPGILARQRPLDRIMASPTFSEAMYKPLWDLAPDRFLPGVGDVPKESIGALLTNQPFIEAYMAGANHEMARELFWRRYPTDRRGTYFQRFWPYADDANPDYDIEPLHTWATNALGENGPQDLEDNLVFLVKGEVIHAYPNTRIYAVRAATSADGEDRIPLLESLRLKLLGEASADQDELPDLAVDDSELESEAWDPREPIFQGRIGSDIQFLGFDLTLEEARSDLVTEEAQTEPGTDEGQDGSETGEGEDHAGWFLVLEEPYGETRFGLNVAQEESPANDDGQTGGDFENPPYGVSVDGSTQKMGEKAFEGDAQAGWNALSWGHLVDSPGALEAKTHVRVLEDRPAGGDGAPWSVQENGEWTGEEDRKTWDTTDAATWGHNSAHMAHIALRLPVRVCIHFDEILPGLTTDDDPEASP